MDAAIEVHGLPQRYHVHGSGEAVCVAVPGGPGLYWDYLRMPLVEQHATVVYVEPLGTGASGRLPSHPDGYTRQIYAYALDRVLDHVGRERVHLLGHGHGGLVAQYYALRHPERLAGLILYGSAPVAGGERADETALRLAEFARRNEAVPEMPAVLAALRSFPRATADERRSAALRRAIPASFAHYWAREDELSPLRYALRMAYLSGFDAAGRPEVIDDRADLPSLSVPTLVTAGRYDIVGGSRWARELQALIPYARLQVLGLSGHFGHVEEPERFAEGVLDLVMAGGDVGRGMNAGAPVTSKR